MPPLEPVEQDRLVDPIQELGTERGPHQRADLLAHVLQVSGALDLVAADVAGHDDDGIAEVDHAALAVGQAAIVEELQQRVEHGRVRLLQLVEQHHRIGPAAHGLGELTAFLVTHVARRRADQPRHGVLLHVLAHVDAGQRALVVEQPGGQRLGQLRLAHAGGAQEDEGPERLFRVGQSALVAADGVGDRRDRVVLADHPVAEDALQLQQPPALALQHLGDRDARPLRDDGGDVLLGHLLPQQARGAAGLRVLVVRRQLRRLLVEAALQGRHRPVADLGRRRQVAAAHALFLLHAHPLELLLDLAHLVDLPLLVLPAELHGVALALHLGQLLLQLGEAFLRGGVVLLGQRLPLDRELQQPPLQAVQLGGLALDLHLQAAGRLIHQVDRLVGQEARGDVAVGEGGRGDDCLVADAHAVMDLVALLEAAQDGDGRFHRRLGGHHRLEAALQGGVLLDVLAVLVQRGGADGAQLAARQGRLEQVGGVHRPLRAAGADQGVQLVDEQDDAAFGAGDLLDHRLEPLLELAAELGSGHQRAQVQGEHAPVAQRFRHVAFDHAPRQPLDDRGLAHARIADQHRVVLGAPRQHLHDPADLLVAADHGVQLLLPGQLGQVAAVALQRVVLALRVLVGDARPAADLLQRGQHRVTADARVAEQAGDRPVGLQQRKKQVLGADVFVVELLGLALGAPQGDRQLASDLRGAGVAVHARAVGEEPFHARLQLGAVDSEPFDQRRDDAVGLLQQGREQVFHLDRAVVVAMGDRVGAPQRLLRLRGQLVVPHGFF